SFTADPTFAKFLVEALSTDGEVLQSFSLWDTERMPSSDYPDISGPRVIDRRLVFRDYLTLPWQIDADASSASDIVLRLTGTDAYGNYSVISRDVRLDAEAARPDFSVLESSKTYGYGSTFYISPNGDGAQDDVLVSITNYEPGQLELHLYPSKADITEADILGVIFKDEIAQPGSFIVPWDGTLSGNPVPDGEYRIEAVLR